MKTITEILQLLAPLAPGFLIHIENRPWKDLVVADTQQTGPNGARVIMVAEGGVRDQRGFPEMLFELERFGDELTLNPLK